MRACARIALISVALSASFCIAACGAIDDLKGGTFRWLDVGKSPEPRVPDVLEATPMVPPDKPLRTEVSKKNRKLAREVQRPQTTEKKLPTSDTPETPKPQQAEPQSVPSQLRTPFPEAPPAGTFSR